MHCLRGNYSKFINPSKFDSRINTDMIASQAILEGDSLREKIKGKRILSETLNQIIVKTKDQDK